MSKPLKSKKLRVQGQLIDLFKDDFKTKYLELVNKTTSLEKENLHWKTALDEIEDIYNNAPCGYHTLDPKGIFLRINNTELSWLGYSRAELIGKKKITDIMSKEDIIRYRKSFLAIQHLGSINEEYNFIRKDGLTMPMLVNSIAIFDGKGKLKACRGTVHDLSGKKLSDQESQQTHKDLKNENIELLQANEEMSLLNDAKDRFIGIAYHDLQNPLAAIMLLSKILLGEEPSGSAANHREKYHAIYEASLQMNELIKNYLNVNRMETGSIIPNEHKVDIIKITEGIISRYQEVAQRKEIPIFFTGARRNIIKTDAECYSQIIENLLSNAIKYTPHRKSIFVKIDTKGADVLISIEDEGVGIREDEIHLLYGKFQTLSSKPTGGELSTGLGLSIVKYLVDQINGTISVKSKLGKGTRFTLCFKKDGTMNDTAEAE